MLPMAFHKMSSLLFYCSFYRIIDLDARMDFLEMATSLVRRNLRLAAMSSTTAADLPDACLIPQRGAMTVTVTLCEDSLGTDTTVHLLPRVLKTRTHVIQMQTASQPETTRASVDASQCFLEMAMSVNQPQSLRGISCWWLRG